MTVVSVFIPSDNIYRFHVRKVITEIGNVMFIAHPQEEHLTANESCNIKITLLLSNNTLITNNLLILLLR